MAVSDGELRQLVNKRLTLNLLIQGIAAHASLTAHHIDIDGAEIRQGLTDINPGIIRHYDRVQVYGTLQLWGLEARMAYGNPTAVWRNISHPDNPFHGHVLLERYGALLAEATRLDAKARARARDLSLYPIIGAAFGWLSIMRIYWIERGNRKTLERLGRRAAHIITGLPEDRMQSELISIFDDVEIGEVNASNSLRTRLLKNSMVGYSNVFRSGDRLKVRARAWLWPFLIHELVKGAAELVCLHGLNSLDSETYKKVIETTDRLENEPPMLQVGPALWRLFLAAAPRDRAIENTLMNVSRLEPLHLEDLMLDVIEQPERARFRLDTL